MMLISHLAKTAVRAFFRLVVTFLIFGMLGVGVSLFIAYQATHVWPPKTLTDVLVAIVGLLLGYAAGLTVLVSEAIRGVRTAEHDVVGTVDRDEERIKHA